MRTFPISEERAGARCCHVWLILQSEDILVTSFGFGTVRKVQLVCLPSLVVVSSAPLLAFRSSAAAEKIEMFAGLRQLGI